MGLWYSESHELCSCCGCTCCCRCRPKQTTPAFVGGFVLLGSAITLTLMLTGSLHIGYYAIPILGFVASFSLLCYVAGISKQVVREEVRTRRSPSSGQQRVIQTAGGTPGLDQWISGGLGALERQRGAAATLEGVTFHRTPNNSTTPLSTTVLERQTPGSAQRPTTPAANTAQRGTTSTSSSVVLNSSVRSNSPSRMTANTSTVSTEYGISSENRGRARPTLVLLHASAAEREASNANAPSYFDVFIEQPPDPAVYRSVAAPNNADVVVEHPPRPVVDRSNASAVPAGRSAMTRPPSRRHPVPDEFGQSNEEHISLEPPPTYESLFLSPVVAREQTTRAL